MNMLLRALGLAPSHQDEKLKELIANTYSSVRIVGRGTVKIDPEEVSKSEEFRRAREQAREIVGL